LLSAIDLISIDDLTAKDIELIWQTTASFKEILKRPIKKVPTLRGKTIINLFLEASTRTRTSFEIAGKRLSADVINISASGSSLVKGESLKDTAKTLESMQPDAVVVRHWSSGAAYHLAQLIQPAVINAGDGQHEHPTQALLDAYTLLEKLGSLKGINFVIVGDIAHSRVARSLIKLMPRLGANLSLVCPPTLLPLGIQDYVSKVYYRLDEALAKADVLYLLRLQQERFSGCFLPTLREYSQIYGLNKERWQKYQGQFILMHPGPVNRGVEADDWVIDHTNALINEQVTNGVAVRMALLYLLIGGVEHHE